MSAEQMHTPDDLHRFAVVSSDYSRPFLAGAYPTIEAATKAQCGSPDKWHIFERSPSASSQERIAQLDGDRAEAVYDAEMMDMAYRNSIAIRDTRIAQLEARVAEAVKVMEPFAGEADLWPEEISDEFLAIDRQGSNVTLADLRAARSFLARAALGAQPLEGWKLVPVEPTQAEIEAGIDFAFNGIRPIGFSVRDYVIGIRAAMLAAAPERIVGAAK